MKYSLTLHNLTLSNDDQDIIEQKLNRLAKILTPPFTVDLAFGHDNHHKSGTVISCRINIKQGQHVFYAKRSSNSAQSATDETIKAIRKELITQKTKTLSQKRRSTHR